MMKRFTSSWCAAATVALLVAGSGLSAQESATLTRAQWLKKVGASVSSDAVLRETMSNLAQEDKAEFAQRVIKAATRLPAGPEEKSAALVKSAVACIAGATGDAKRQVIAEVFAGTPVEFLPVVSEELAKRFDQEFNKLSNEQFEKIAADTLAACVKENAETDAPSVRNTFVILSFLRGAKDPALQNKLISQLPDERMRNLAASWIPPALKDKNYAALIAAADADDIDVRNIAVLRLIGHSNLDRLLADLNANQGARPFENIDEISTNGVKAAQDVLPSGDSLLQTDGEGAGGSEAVWIPLSQVRAVGGHALGIGAHALEYGIGPGESAMGAGGQSAAVGVNRPPLYPVGYQNQGTSVTPRPGR
ncbi:MAG: hypothetical protein GX565_10295 [Lentisphaerae bacterium]|nr:hypothetical protein [Lentisphaerota bacterium]